MRLSTRNQLHGTIESVEIGAGMATVRIRLDGGDQIVISAVTKDAAQPSAEGCGALARRRAITARRALQLPAP